LLLENLPGVSKECSCQFGLWESLSEEKLALHAAARLEASGSSSLPLNEAVADGNSRKSVIRRGGADEIL
jgi:hypothetical protein